jgi:hypothetical protein
MADLSMQQSTLSTVIYPYLTKYQGLRLLFPQAPWRALAHGAHVAATRPIAALPTHPAAASFYQF